MTGTGGEISSRSNFNSDMIEKTATECRSGEKGFHYIRNGMALIAECPTCGPRTINLDKKTPAYCSTNTPGDFSSNYSIGIDSLKQVTK